MQQSVSGVKQIIAVASGKGGVGKSTVAVNLALALAATGLRVGLLDADIYGPSVPLMLGAPAGPEVVDEGGRKKFRPVSAYGIEANSIGWLVGVTAALVWRGPMATAALQQLLYDTLWGDLDYLVVDLPPGTGDILLTLTQKIPLTGALIVTTPQDLALADARRAAEMFRRVSVPLLGIVENMSLHTCTNCGHTEAIFGAGGGEKLAGEYGMPLLGSLPLDGAIAQAMEAGKPTVAVDPSGRLAGYYKDIAQRVLEQAGRQSETAADFPEIVIVND